MGERPDAVDPDRTPERIAAITDTGQLPLLGEHPIAFSLADDIILHRNKQARFHSNAMVFRAFDHTGAVLAERTFYSIGGGFVVDDTQVSDGRRPCRGRRPDAGALPVPHRRRAAGPRRRRPGCASATSSWPTKWPGTQKITFASGCCRIWSVMQECIQAGINTTTAVLPGGLKVRRRAPLLAEKLSAATGSQ